MLCPGRRCRGIRRWWGQHCDPGSHRVRGSPPDTHGRRHSVAGMGPVLASARPSLGTVQSATQASLELSGHEVAWSPSQGPSPWRDTQEMRSDLVTMSGALSLEGHRRDRKWPGHQVGGPQSAGTQESIPWWVPSVFPLCGRRQDHRGDIPWGHAGCMFQPRCPGPDAEVATP